MLVSTLMVPLIYVDFELRKEYIAKVLCIEKDRPMTVCGGRCYLTAQLEKAASQDQDAKVPTRHVEVSFFKHEVIGFDFLKRPFPVKTSFPEWNHKGHFANYTSGVFRPPQS